MRHKNLFAVMFLCTLCVSLGTSLLSGCASSRTTATSRESSDSELASASKGGAQLWSENCNRCHNSRAPDSYSDDQWQVTVHHMRLIAGLTGEQQRKITEFLKSAN